MSEEEIIQFKCSKCQAKYTALAIHAGKKALCKKCGSEITIPKFSNSQSKLTSEIEDKNSDHVKIDNNKIEKNKVERNDKPDSKKTTKVTTKKQGNQLWINILSVVLLTLSIILIVIEILKYPNYSIIIGEMIGNSLVRSIVITTVLYFGWKAILKNKKGSAFLLFSAIFFIITSYYNYKLYQTDKHISETKAAFKDATSKLNNLQNEEKNNYINTNNRKYGEMNQFMNLFGEHLNQITEIHNKMNYELNELNIENSLTEQTLGKLYKIRKAQKDLEKAIAILDKYEIQFKSLSFKMTKNLESLDKNTNFKQKVAEGYKSGIQNGIQNLKEYFFIERSSFSTTYKLLQFLENKQAKYWFENGKIYFELQNDVDIYNKYIEEVNRIAKQEEIWFEKQQSNINVLEDTFK